MSIKSVSLPSYALYFDKNGLKGCDKTPLDNSDKKLLAEIKKVMNYKGSNDVDTINYMCKFLFNQEKLGTTGFEIESLIDQSSIRSISEAVAQTASFEQIIGDKKRVSDIKKLARHYSSLGYKYVYKSIFTPDSDKKVVMYPLTVQYMKNVLYTYAKMIQYIPDGSDDPTDADDVISDLALNQR